MRNNDLDFLLISPAKATKDDKSTKDDKAAKDPAYGRGCRRTRIVKVRKPMRRKKQHRQMLQAAAKKKVVEAKKKEAELKKKQEAKLKKQNQAGSKYKKVTPPPDEQDDFAPESDVENSELVRSAIIKEFRENMFGLSTTAVSSSFDFPTVGHDGTTWMRKNVTPSSAIYDPLAPVDPALYGIGEAYAIHQGNSTQTTSTTSTKE
ncbi:hypothetical protein HID58_091034, partial [Brassica napus]